MTRGRPADLSTVSLLRRSRPGADDVDVSARLAGYEATSTSGLDGPYASGYPSEARSSVAADRGAPGHIAAPVDVAEERRAEVRHPLQLSVRAKSRSGEEWRLGRTVDASMSGLCVEMPCRPEEAHLDLEIASTETITAWARVVGVSPVDEHRFRWRLRLLSYDASYAALLGQLDPVATLYDLPLVATAVVVDAESLLVDALSSDELVHRTTA